MSAKDLLTTGAPFPPEQLSRLQQTLAQASPLQLAWLSGYTWALSQSSSVTLAAEGAVTTAAARPLITLWSASQTGNARRVAEQLQQQLQAQGWQVEHWRSGEVKTKTLAQLSVLLVVAATYGEGEPPEEALGLHKFLLSARAPKLEHLRYAVLGLGDSSYEHFCQTGKDFDRRLSELGAQPLLARVDADVDFAATASHWQQEVLAALAPLAAAAGESPSSVVTPVAAAVGTVYQRDNPCTVSLLARQKITGRNSSKDIQHIELDLAGTGLTYQPGDALGVWQHNDPALVAE
ncbi:MAG: flavodoxin domain-containing protein, partial [Plesiomonas shigelloides]